MWRWVTRGFVLAVLAALLAPALAAQGFIGDLEKPVQNSVQSGIVLVQGWALDPGQISRIELYVDNQYQHDLILNLARIDIVEAFPTFPGIHISRPGFLTGFSANRFSSGTHEVELKIFTSVGAVHFLGPRTIQIDNSVTQAPFGHFVIPNQAGVTNPSTTFP